MENDSQHDSKQDASGNDVWSRQLGGGTLTFTTQGLGNPVAAFRIFTWAFTMIAPEWSRTTPVMVPDSTICARSCGKAKLTNIVVRANRLMRNRFFPLLPAAALAAPEGFAEARPRLLIVFIFRVIEVST